MSAQSDAAATMLAGFRTGDRVRFNPARALRLLQASGGDRRGYCLLDEGFIKRLSTGTVVSASYPWPVDSRISITDVQWDSVMAIAYVETVDLELLDANNL